MDENILSRFDTGINKFNSGEYYECHDILEDVWFDVRGTSRRFYQGLIHLAVGFYHILHRKNPKGAISQLTKGKDKLSGYLPQFQGVELAELLSHIDVCITEITKIKNGETDSLDESLIPRIKFDKRLFVEP